MNILLVTGLFQPEPNHLKGLAFARELQRRGHDVHVLTSIPNYPGGRVYPGYRMTWRMHEEVEGVPVTRVGLYASHDTSAMRRAASYVSLGLSEAVQCLVSRKRFDVCHVYMGPITLMWPALIARWRTGTRIVADVQDIWPESVTDSGMMSSRALGWILSRWSLRSYRAADRLVVLSPGYKEMLVARGIPPERIEVVYNWSDERTSESRDASEVDSDVLRPEATSVLYAGNLGKLQGIDTIIDAAKQIRATHPTVEFVLIGDGVDREKLQRRVAEERITNVRFTGRLPVERVNGLLKRAALLLIHVKSSALTRVGIPQKVQAYLASGTPILLAGEGDCARLLERSGGGITCPPDDVSAIAENIRRLVAMDAATRAEMGRRGRRYYVEQLSFARGVERMERLFLDTVDATRRRRRREDQRSGGA